MTPHEHSSGHGHDHFDKRFKDAEKWAEIFDDPKRDQWQRPDKTIEALAIADNETIADIGSGTGYFAIRIAKEHPRSEVFAVDVEPDMVAYVEKRAKGESLSNVQPLLVSTTEKVILPETVNHLLVVNAYHHIPDRVSYFKNLSSYLKDKGALVIIDFTLESPRGSAQEHRIQPAQIEEELLVSGYEQIKSFDFLPYQFFLVFQKLKNVPQ